MQRLDLERRERAIVDDQQVQVAEPLAPVDVLVADHQPVRRVPRGEGAGLGQRASDTPFG